MWRRLHGVSGVRAVIDAARALNFLDEATHRWLLRETGEAIDDPEDILTNVNPMPSTVWAKTSASGSVVPPSGWNPSTMASIFKYLTSQAKSVSTYTTNPLWQIVDGPYKLSQYNTTTGAFTMVPNKTYGGPHVTPMSNFQAVAFTSDAAEFNAVKSKSIDVGFVPAANIPQLPQVLRLGYNYFGEPDFGMNFLNYNFEDKTNHFNSIISQLYFRQAMAHLEDQQGWISAFMHGAGAPAYGPIPAYPKSPFLPANAATNPYPFSISTATNLLSHHGWKVNAGAYTGAQATSLGGGQYQFSFGGTAAVGDTVSYYVAAQDSAPTPNVTTNQSHFVFLCA